MRVDGRRVALVAFPQTSHPPEFFSAKVIQITNAQKNRRICELHHRDFFSSALIWSQCFDGPVRTRSRTINP